MFKYDWTLVAAGLALGTSGCWFPGVGGPGGDDDDDSTYEQPDWPSNVMEIQLGDDVSGDLSGGEFIDLNWADNSTVACWPGNEDMNFQGPHQFFGLRQSAGSEFFAAVTPDSDVDVSLYVIQMPSGDYQVPPYVESVVTCEASYDAPSNSNPGVVEETSVWSLDLQYNVLIGVAGAAGHDAGGFELETWEDQG